MKPSQAIVDEKSPQFSGWFTSLDRARTVPIDEHTVCVVFTEARTAQLLAFNISVLPAHVYEKRKFTEVSDVVGNRAYVLAQRVPGRSILLRCRSDAAP